MKQNSHEKWPYLSKSQSVERLFFSRQEAGKSVLGGKRYQFYGSSRQLEAGHATT